MSLRPITETRRTAHNGRRRRSFAPCLWVSGPSELDPFLLFDDFRNERPEDFCAGSHGIPIEALKPLPMYCQELWNTATVWATKAHWVRAMSNG